MRSCRNGARRIWNVWWQDDRDTLMQNEPSIFEFDWDEARGLDLHLIDWEARATRGGSASLYSK